MADTVDDTTEPQDTKGDAPTYQPKKSYKFLETDEFKNVKSPLVAPFLQLHIDRLEEEVSELKPFMRLYYETKSIVDANNNSKKLGRIAASLVSVMLTVGGVGFGVAKDLWSNGPYGMLIALGSVMLVVSSFFVKVQDS